MIPPIAPTRHAGGGSAAVELSPFGVLRVAAWPLETLDQLGCPGLLERARELALGGQAARRRFEVAYQEALARERAVLWRETAGSERFMKALAIANVELMQRVRERAAQPLDGAPNKRTRHLETTLYRLLARAVGRTEPFGAWCGVGMVELGEETELRRVVPRRAVAPSLAFFAHVLRQLGARREHARLASYRINPTLGRMPDGSWGFLAPPGHEPPGHRVVDSSPLLDAALERLSALERFCITEAEQVLSVEPGALDGFFFDQLVAQGLVVGGLALPPFFSDPWEALERVEADLPLLRAQAWTRLRESLSELCRRVEDEYDAARAQQIAELCLGAQACARRFGAEIGLPDLPRLSLYMDCGAPFRLTIGRRLARALRGAVERDEADTSGAVRAFNERFRRAQCERLGERGLPVAGLPPDALVDASRAGDWPPVDPAQYFPEWPLRSAIVDFEQIETSSSQSPRVGQLNLVDDVASALSRFLPLLHRQEAAGAEALEGWLRRAHESCREPPLAAFGEVDTRVPNALAQPDLGLPRFSLWSVAPGVGSLAGARLVALPGRGLVAVRVGEQIHSLVSLSAVNLIRDPALELLMMSSLRLPRARAAADGKPQLGESLDGANALGASALRQLARHSGSGRFVAWAQALGSRCGQKLVRRPAAAPMLTELSSPLAVAALLEGVDAGWRVLELQAASELPVLRDGARRFVARAVLPFCR